MHLRSATLADVPAFEAWDRDPAVIAATSDDPEAETAFAGADWADEIVHQSDVSYFLVAEVDGRPIGAMQIIDPQREPTGYWGDCAPNLRAIDIWIGSPADRGKGYGAEMMRLALAQCFADANVSAVLIDPLNSNVRAHAFYQRLGFIPLGRRLFGDDDCLVHQLTRQTWREKFPGDHDA